MMNIFRLKRRIIILIIGIISLLSFMAIAYLDMTDTNEEKVKINLSGDGTKERPYCINNTDDYLYFVECINSGYTSFKKQYINIENDIKLEGTGNEIMCGRAEDKCIFKGVLDGNGHTISGITISTEESVAGLFEELKGTILNLRVEGSVKGRIAGGIAGKLNESGKIINCQSLVTVSGENAGVIVGENNGMVKNCYIPLSEQYIGVEGDKGVCENNSNDISELNYGLGQLELCYQYSEWGLVNNKVCLLTDKEDEPDEIYLKVRFDGRETIVNAFYNEIKKQWYAVLPRAVDNNEITFYIETKNNSEIVYTGSANTTELSIGNTEYPIDIIVSEGVASVNVETRLDNGYKYLIEDKENRLSGKIYTYDPETNTEAVNEVMAIHGRGNDSWVSAEKKGFAIKFVKETSLLGMREQRYFNLLPGYRDASFMSYVILRDLAKDVWKEEAHEYVPVNFYIDGEYIGVYLLTQKISIGENNIDIVDSYEETRRINGKATTYSARRFIEEYNNPYKRRVWYDIKNEPEDITGGYIFELNYEDFDEGQSRFYTDNGLSITLASNYYATMGQVAYCADLWQKMENAVMAENGYNEDGIFFTNYMDINSFADQWIMYELAMETSLWASVFYYKDSDLVGDGKIHALWMWDSEHSFGATEDYDYSWIIDNGFMQGGYDYFRCYIWTKLFEHPEFREALNREWTEKYVPVIEKLYAEDAEYNPEGLSSFAYYKSTYLPMLYVDSIRWNNEEEGEEKLNNIERLIEVRAPYLTDYFSNIAK